MTSAAVIGLGFIGAAHIEALRRVGIPVAGILGSSPESGQRAAAQLGLRAYASLDELLADPQVGAVHQCGPNAVHAPHNLRCLAAGKRIFAEKPLGISVRECEAQLAAAQASGLRHAVNFTYRGYAAVQALRQLVLSGELGQVHTLRGHHLQDWLLFPDDFNWRVTARAEETRAVADIGSHLFDLARCVSGLEATRLLARFHTLHPERRRPLGSVQSFQSASGESVAFTVETEDAASLLLDFGDVRATFEVSQVAPGHKNDLQIEVLGTRGSATWRQERPEELRLGQRGADQVLRLKDPAHAFTHYPGGHPEGYPDALTNLVRAFYQGGGEELALPSFADGLAAARFVEAAYASSRDERWVTWS